MVVQFPLEYFTADLSKGLNPKSNNNGSSYIAHFTMSQCALQPVEDFFGLHIMAPLAAKQLTIMRDN